MSVIFSFAPCLYSPVDQEAHSRATQQREAAWGDEATGEAWAGMAGWGRVFGFVVCFV
jgi:hypothetical protein